jgi:hypothetical protein
MAGLAVYNSQVVAPLDRFEFSKAEETRDFITLVLKELG